MGQVFGSGECPQCGKHDIEYGDEEHESMSLGYHASCSDCGCHFVEWYELEYVESTILTEGKGGINDTKKVE